MSPNQTHPYGVKKGKKNRKPGDRKGKIHDVRRARTVGEKETTKLLTGMTGKKKKVRTRKSWGAN